MRSVTECQNHLSLFCVLLALSGCVMLERSRFPPRKHYTLYEIMSPTESSQAVAFREPSSNPDKCFN